MRNLKKIGALVLSLVCVLSMTSCVKTKKGVEHYQYMYDVVEDWNKHSDPNREDLFGFGEYLYNSYLLLFPRETPSTLTDFYFYWCAGIDVDDYAAYFTCQLTEEKFDSFVEGLDNFTITTEAGSTKLLYDEENFQYPAYITQWMNYGEKWETLEYVLLDDAQNTVVFVYTMLSLEQIQLHANYNVLPKTANVIAADKENLDEGIIYHSKGFTVYNHVYGGLEGVTYDISFLEYLK